MAKPRYWLLKSEPEVFSIDDLQRKGRDDWDGVRNYQARNFMQDMKVGDLALFYHSRAEPPAVVGVCRVSRTAAPDLTAQDPKHRYFDPKATPENPIWMCVQVEYVEHLPRPVTLPELKSEPALAGMELTRKGSRLSVQPVRPEEWETVMRLARQDGAPAPAVAELSKAGKASLKAATTKKGRTGAKGESPAAKARKAERSGKEAGLTGALKEIAGTLARDAAEMVSAFARAATRPKKGGSSKATESAKKAPPPKAASAKKAKAVPKSKAEAKAVPKAKAAPKAAPAPGSGSAKKKADAAQPKPGAARKKVDGARKSDAASGNSKPTGPVGKAKPTQKPSGNSKPPKPKPQGKKGRKPEK